MRLSQIIRRLPTLIYAGAIIFFVWGMGNAWVNLVEMSGYDDASLEGLVAVQKSTALYQASLESFWLVIYGAILQTLIAIYDAAKGNTE